MTSKLYLPRRQVVIYMYLTYCLKKIIFIIMMDDDIGELVLTVIHLQAPLDSGKFHAPVLSTCARIVRSYITRYTLPVLQWNMYG